VTIFQVDERVAPDGDPDRNLNPSFSARSRPAALGRAPMPVWADDLDAAAAQYADELPPSSTSFTSASAGRAHGVRSSPATRCSSRGPDVAVTGEYQGRRRMTLTYPALNRARAILWLVTGEDKVDALARLRAATSRSRRASRRTCAGRRRRRCGRI
jgi:6-phosphogluconolactonase/glucosamine-6-phosphate isomerase/deaminase